MKVDIKKPINKEILANFNEKEFDAKPINYEDIPPIQEKWLEKIAMRKKITKKQISIRLDSDIIDFFKKENKHYQSHINTILRAYLYRYCKSLIIDLLNESKANKSLANETKTTLFVSEA